MRKIVLPVLILLLLAAPWIIAKPFFVHLMIMVLLWTVLGASWNLLGGFTGQVSFGHATFLGAGAYTMMILYLKLGLDPWYGILIGGLVAALIALPIGYICFRLRGPYFALSTLAVAEIVRLVALNWESLTAGPVGLLITTLPKVTFWGQTLNWESKPPFFLYRRGYCPGRSPGHGHGLPITTGGVPVGGSGRYRQCRGHWDQHGPGPGSGLVLIGFFCRSGRRFLCHVPALY